MRGQVSFCCIPDCRSMIVYLIILCIIYASFFPIFPALKMLLLVALVACGRHGVQSLMEMSCKSTIKQEVSTLPGTSINRNMTCWVPVKPREDMTLTWEWSIQATSAKSNPNLICSQSSQRSDWYWMILVYFDHLWSTCCLFSTELLFSQFQLVSTAETSMQKIKTRSKRSMSKSFRHFSGTREAPNPATWHGEPWAWLLSLTICLGDPKVTKKYPESILINLFYPFLHVVNDFSICLHSKT